MTAATAPNALEREEQAIRALSARWLRAVDARDLERIAAVYAADGMFLVPNAPPARGRDMVGAVWGQLLATPGLSLEWTPNSIAVAQAGDMASEIGTYRLVIDAPTGRVEDDGKYVVVWRKHDGEWRVAADIFNSNRPLPSSSAGS